jgi:hypothetical protein
MKLAQEMTPPSNDYEIFNDFEALTTLVQKSFMEAAKGRRNRKQQAWHSYSRLIWWQAGCSSASQGCDSQSTFVAD